MKPAELRVEREKHWKELEGLVDRIEKRGLKSLSVSEARQLGGLYRLTVSSYAVLKGLSLDRKLVHYLHTLATRAYLAIYHYDMIPNVSPAKFFTRTWPGLVRKHAAILLLVIAVMFASVSVSLFMAKRDPQMADYLIPAEMAQGRSSAATKEELAKILVSGRESDAAEKGVFSAFLFTHNTKVGMMCFAVGLLGGIPSVILLGWFGTSLGALAGLYHVQGLAVPFWAWILPHGITELLAAMICTQAGMVLGLSIIRPRKYRWRDAVAIAGRECGLMVLGTVLMFFVAGIIEGVLRQSHMSTTARYVTAVITLLGWMAYFVLCKGRPEDDVAAADEPRLREL
jgi:uncharacterized membrane protein SpoIIM required for sporulation